MGLFRPSREEYDVIEVLGNPGWNWEDMLKYTKKVAWNKLTCHLSLTEIEMRV